MWTSFDVLQGKLHVKVTFITCWQCCRLTRQLCVGGDVLVVSKIPFLWQNVT